MNKYSEKFLSVRKRSTELCQPLKVEDYLPQPAEFTSPPKWHLAHSTWFFEEMILKKFVQDYKVFHEDFSFLFNSYYETIGQRIDRGKRGDISRPTIDEVYEYRKYVDEKMLSVLEKSLDNESLLTLVVLGLNHEQQHQELLLTDLKYTFGNHPLFPVYRSDFNLVKDHNQENGWLEFEEDIYEIGFDGDGFCFDNERTKHKVYQHAFGIAKNLVTNGEFIAFMEDGGYQKFKHWLDEGWQWVNENKIEHPLYWHKIDNVWHHYTLAGLQPIDKDAILSHVSFYEADAYAHWKNLRLPTEFEWEIAADKMNWGKRWEWTNSAYLPYPKFKIKEGAVGEYNGKFMVNQMVLKGASTATSIEHSRKTYRNFFHPHFQWQFSGIRLAMDI